MVSFTIQPIPTSHHIASQSAQEDERFLLACSLVLEQAKFATLARSLVIK